MNAPDHIIVGSGINALVCAAMLGGKGAKVLVLERNDRIGGCMRTEEITAPGFIHDVMATTFVLFITSPAYAALGKDLARHGLEFCNTGTPTGVLRPDGSHAILRTDRPANVAGMNTMTAGDGDRHGSDVGEIERNAGLLFGLLGGSLWSYPTAKLLAGEAWRRGPRGLAAFLGEALVPARGWLERSYQSETTRALWAPWVLHAGLGPEDAFSGQIARVIAFALEAAGAPIVKGGAKNLLSAFEALIKERGGVIRTGGDVASIVQSGGRATGVRLASGETVTAKKSVICSVTPTQLYERLLGDAAPKADVEATQKYRYGKGNFQIHYALDKPPAWRGDGLDKVALLHLTPGLDGVSKACNEATRGMLPEVPTICVGQPHALDPSRCPDGKAILWLQLPEAPRHIKGDAAGKLPTPADGRWTEALREAYADRAEAILASHIAGFKDSVIARRAYSPADLETMNINLVGGDPYGGSSAIDQSFLWRPFKTSRNHATGVKGLYHIGASTHPGAGLGGGSGFLLAGRL
ncbi:NAD(P)/FAD-dependent oxidoreductase [Mesorhizobium sp. M6A.T.Cr.TU.017.01.1.1]|uniref:phytoene desaturase family protein n=1 Tax=Mesorhizobium sp. M6A.T.Cr.TU.017.01.1.1 TaxID=2496774 RepID=UPI000FD4F3FC|nr:NAD(P)/FAD-dependent oxidoreductase [Mesorhizobium sp. M6A.T.Cr.TU.017.01.1.1]RUV01233.1 NAD(P)/FAD-dependent oxidoreductase [Mesorhizobium sp. M6A.T.Cr.TU.017.01.1.1]